MANKDEIKNQTISDDELEEVAGGGCWFGAKAVAPDGHDSGCHFSSTWYESWDEYNYKHDICKYWALKTNLNLDIYFSFYDTGAIGLKEIQNYGVFAFTHQKDLVIDNETSFYIPELSTIDNISLASKKIIDTIDIVSKKNPNLELIAKKNQMINNCQNSLRDLCKSLLHSWILYQLFFQKDNYHIYL